MVNPQPDNYSAPSGAGIYAGRYSYPHIALLNQIAAAPGGSWLRVNSNKFSDVWPDSDYRPLFGAGASNPAAIIKAWSSFAWDSVNHRMILWGGGHANTADNSVYVWDASTMQWYLGFYPSDVVNNTSGQEAVDGPLNTAVSSHTYDNQVYLTVLDRFLTFGGAAQSSGGQFVVTDANGDTVRSLPGYMLDLSEAGTGQVAGTTGSNVQRGTTVGVTLNGANAWQPLDYLLDNPYASVLSSTASINTWTHHAVENGKDVVFKTAHGSPMLFKFTFDGLDYTDHVIEKLGIYWNSVSASDQGGAVDNYNNIAVGLSGDSTKPFYGWDLSTASSSNKNFVVQSTGVSGSGATEFLSDFGNYGFDYDSNRRQFIAWGGGGAVYGISAPSNDDYSTGWVITKIADPATRPMTRSELATAGAADTGVSGKFKFAPDLDCYVGLQHINNGDVWLFKPTDWIDPR